jgi:hypothetical protein
MCPNHSLRDDAGVDAFVRDLYAVRAYRWVMRLRAAYEQIINDHGLLRVLRPPVLRVEERTSFWGQWDPETRTITLAARAMIDQPWHVVREILKHEVAHQLASEGFKAGTPHGEAFARACDVLHVAPWARSATGELPAVIPDWHDAPSADKEAKLLNRVEKLLALATSSNEHEALSAMQRVRELQSRYNLEELRAARRGEFVWWVYTPKLKRLGREYDLIASILVSHFFVEVVFMQDYDAMTGEEYRAIEVIGKRQDVLMAEYVLRFLLGSVKSLWERYRDDYRKVHGRAPGQIVRNTYYRGVLRGFAEKLETSHAEQRAATSATDRQLVQVGNKQLQEYLHGRYPRLTTERGGMVRHDPEAFAAGHAAGGSLVLSKPVTGETRERGHLLGSGK